MRRFAVLMLAGVTATALGAQQKQPLTIERYITTPTVGDPQLTPDGALVAFTIATPSLDSNRTTTKIWLADEGYDPVYGARPLKRVIQRHLQDPLAQMILAGDVLDGATVTISAGPDGLLVGDRVSVTRRERPAAAVVH